MASQDSEILGNLFVHDFRDGGFPGASQIRARELMAEVELSMEGCLAYVVRCKEGTRARELYTTDPAYRGPEYERIASLGSRVGIDDVDIICKANELCNVY